MTALLQVTGLGKRFGGFVALEAIDLAVEEGERLGLIGPNGSGKSTLVNCICGTLPNETGSVQFAGDGLDAHDLPRFQDAEQLGLKLEREVVDVVEDDGAVVGELKEPLLLV